MTGGVKPAPPSMPSDPLGSLFAALPGPLSDWALSFSANLYFNTITFTTISYDARPVTATAQTMAAVESFLGAALLALLVAVTVQRLRR